MVISGGLGRGCQQAMLTIQATVMYAHGVFRQLELIPVTGPTLMVVTGVLTPRSAVHGLNWNILAIIAGSAGLGVIVSTAAWTSSCC